MIQTLPLMAGLVGLSGFQFFAGGQSVRPGAVGARVAADLVGGVAQWPGLVMSPLAVHPSTILSGSLLKKLLLRGRSSVVVVTGERCSSWL